MSKWSLFQREVAKRLKEYRNPEAILQGFGFESRLEYTKKLWTVMKKGEDWEVQLDSDMATAHCKKKVGVDGIPLCVGCDGQILPHVYYDLGTQVNFSVPSDSVCGSCSSQGKNGEVLVFY